MFSIFDGPDCYAYTQAEFRRIPGLVHGFGTARFTAERFAAWAEDSHLIPVGLKQIHSDIIRVINRIPESPLEGDALLTDLPGVLLMVKTADCLPLLLTADPPKAVAAVHCGWRGTAAGIAGKAAAKLEEVYRTPPHTLSAVLGPCIEMSCYQVDEVVKGRFPKTLVDGKVFVPDTEQPGKYFLDMRAAVSRQLMEAGLREDRILHLPACTFCQSELFSFRRHPKRMNRLLNFIGRLF